MLDIKFVRNNPDVVKQNIKNKFQDEKLPLVDEVIELDKRNREIKQEVEALRAEKNKASKEIGAMMAQKKIEEAEALKKMLADRNTEVAGMLELDVPEDMLMDRLINRGKTSGRADDNAETIKKRLDVYNGQTAPLIEWYEKEGKRHAVKGYGALEEINAALCAVIDSL